LKKERGMEKLKQAHFECIKEDNSEEEDDKQWKRSKIVFDQFYDYLTKEKSLKESTAGRRTEMAAFFVMNYLFVYDDAMSVLEVYGDTIRTFLGNWYIRKTWNPSISRIKSSLRALSDFFTFLYKKGFMAKEQLNEIKEVCKDTGWFEMRLKKYFEANGDDFDEWLQEYNYDW
jgi:hypothetical protein